MDNPEFELLADALTRVVRSGRPEEEAKTNICYALRGGKIRIRVRVADRSTSGGGFFPEGNVAIPLILSSLDLDWANSRPLKPWSIGPMLGQHYAWLDGWKNRSLDLILLSTQDVIEVLCSQSFQEADKAPASAVTVTDDEARTVILAEMEANNGTISQENGAKAVRRKYKGFNKKHAMALVKEMTGNDTPGPKGPRRRMRG